jgi:hypothetical protein
MVLKPLKKLTGLELSLSKTVQYVEEWVSQIIPNPFISGVSIDIELDGTNVSEVSHGLGQVPTGWILTDKNSDCRVWRTSWSNKTITFDSSAATTIKVWVF